MQIVAYGAGTNSTAMLVGLVERAEVVNVILFADTGGERPETYAYVQTFSDWLVSKGYPKIVTVKTKSKHANLEQKCLTLKTLPSIAFGYKTCSLEHKRRPQDSYMVVSLQANTVWMGGKKVVKCVGFDADEPHRAKVMHDEKYEYRYPLLEWGWGRDECIAAIDRAGLPQPGKSACFFCPSSKKSEILELKEKHPDLLARALAMEANAKDLISVRGLGRKFSWREFVEGQEQAGDCSIDAPCECYDGSA